MPVETSPPTIRARASCLWAPTGSTPVPFEVDLWSNGTVNLTGEAPFGAAVTGSTWAPEFQAIAERSGYWGTSVPVEAQSHLLLKATNALRRELALGAHPSTGAFPGSE
jgi:hypothetical protein